MAKTYIPRGQNFDTHLDNVPLRLNSRQYTQASGSSIGVQCRPAQAVTTTGDVIGAEFSPRTSDVGAGALIALRADPVLQTATGARTVSAVRGVEVNIDFPDSGSAYTITNHVNAFRTYLDMGSGHTVSGRKSVFLIATPNTSGWGFLFELEPSAGCFNTTASNGAQIGQILIYVGGQTREIPYYATS